MPFQKLNSKLERHLALLAEGSGRKIKATDVGKIIAKLEKRRAKLLDEVATAPHKTERLAHKIDAADEMLGRARWLQKQLQNDAGSEASKD